MAKQGEPGERVSTGDINLEFREVPEWRGAMAGRAGPTRTSSVRYAWDFCGGTIRAIAQSSSR